MTILVTIPLDTEWQAWRVYTGSDEVHDERRYEFDLSAWTADDPKPGWEMIFERQFYLEPLEDCARYLLHIGALPGVTAIYLGGDQPIGGGSATPLTLDVTDYVALEDNHLRLTVNMETVVRGKRFGSIWLDAVPCD